RGGHTRSVERRACSGSQLVLLPPTAKVLSDVGPTFAEGQRTRTEGPALALPFPRPPRGLHAVTRQARPKRRHQHRAHTVAATRHRVGLSVNEQGFANVVPGEGDFLSARYRPLGPEITRVAGLAEFGINDGNGGVH